MAGIGESKIHKSGIDALFQELSEKGIANGYAGLDGSSKIPDINISASSVTQHEASISHDSLAGYNVNQHRVIDDAVISTTTLWSSTKIRAEIESVLGFTFGGVHTAVQDTTELKAIDTSAALEYPDKGLILVEANGWYRFDRDSSEAEDIDRIVEPSTGPGRWIQMSGNYSDHNLLKTIQGGTTGEFFHLSLDAFNATQQIEFQPLPTDTNRFVTDLDSRLPTQAENDALNTISGQAAPTLLNRFVTDQDTRVQPAGEAVQGTVRMATQVEAEDLVTTVHLSVAMSPLRVNNWWDVVKDDDQIVSGSWEFGGLTIKNVTPVLTIMDSDAVANEDFVGWVSLINESTMVQVGAIGMQVAGLMEVANLLADQNLNVRVTGTGKVRLLSTGGSGETEVVGGNFGVERDSERVFEAITDTAVLVADDTAIRVNVWDGAAWEGIQQVTVGVDDSGGTGFRLLRIPN